MTPAGVEETDNISDFCTVIIGMHKTLLPQWGPSGINPDDVMELLRNYGVGTSLPSFNGATALFPGSPEISLFGVEEAGNTTLRVSIAQQEVNKKPTERGKLPSRGQRGRQVVRYADDSDCHSIG